MECLCRFCITAGVPFLPFFSKVMVPTCFWVVDWISGVDSGKLRSVCFLDDEVCLSCCPGKPLLFFLSLLRFSLSLCNSSRPPGPRVSFIILALRTEFEQYGGLGVKSALNAVVSNFSHSNSNH